MGDTWWCRKTHSHGTLACLRAENEQLRQGLAAGDIYRRERDSLKETLAAERAAHAVTREALARTAARASAMEAGFQLLQQEAAPTAAAAEQGLRDSIQCYVDSENAAREALRNARETLDHEHMAHAVTKQSLRRMDTINASLREALGDGTPWPIIEVLGALSGAVRHMFEVHDCDCSGWERFKHAATEAERLSLSIRSILAANLAAFTAAPPAPVAATPCCAHYCDQVEDGLHRGFVGRDPAPAAAPAHPAVPAAPGPTACPGYCRPPGEACSKPCALGPGHKGRCSCAELERLKAEAASPPAVPEKCGTCGGPFREPTGFGDQPDGMQWIRCKNCPRTDGRGPTGGGR